MTPYPSFPKSLLLATILATGLTTPLMASSTEAIEVFLEEEMRDPATPAQQVEALTDIPLDTPVPAQVPTKSWFTGWFGATQETQDQDATVEVTNESTPQNAVSQESSDVTLDPTAATVSSTPSQGRSLLNIMTFGLLGASGEDITSPAATSSQSAPVQDENSDTESYTEESELYTPQEGPSSQMPGGFPQGMLDADISSSVVYSAQQITKRFEAQHVSFPHPNWTNQNMLGSVELPSSGKNFSLYAPATYTLAFATHTLTLSGTDLDQAIRRGKDLTGAWLCNVLDGDTLLASFDAKDFDTFADANPTPPAYIAANHLFYETISQGADMKEATPSPMAVFSLSGTSVVISQEDIITIKPEGDKPRHVPARYLKHFLEENSQVSLHLIKITRGQDVTKYNKKQQG